MYLSNHNYLYFLDLAQQIPGKDEKTNEDFISVSDDNVHLLMKPNQKKYIEKWKSKYPGKGSIMRWSNNLPEIECKPIFDILQKGIIITQELEDFVSYGYKTKDEKIQSIRHWSSIGLAITLSSLSFIISIVGIFHSSQSTKISTILVEKNQLDSLIQNQINSAKIDQIESVSGSMPPLIQIDSQNVK